MLDLFTVPFVPQLPSYNLSDRVPHLLTYGGATEGRVNINSPEVPYPFGEDASVNSTPPIRKGPLEALFFGLTPSTSYQSNSDIPIFEAAFDASRAATLADAVRNYRNTAAHPVFMLPGQLCEVPEIDAFTYTHTGLSSGTDKARSRNDVVRDVIGAVTTQSNTFSIWVVAQAVAKKPGNGGYGDFQKGDVVTGETRRRYLIERFIETGSDGVPGNAITPGSVGSKQVVGSVTDVVAGNADPTQGVVQPGPHPKLPYPLPYRWKIVAVEDVK
jgi:hypothetical protein